MSAADEPVRRPSRRAIILALVGLGLVLLGIGNAHLVYVALTSQPECALSAGPADGARYRAARASC